MPLYELNLLGRPCGAGWVNEDTWHIHCPLMPVTAATALHSSCAALHKFVPLKTNNCLHKDIIDNYQTKLIMRLFLLQTLVIRFKIMPKIVSKLMLTSI